MSDERHLFFSRAIECAHGTKGFNGNESLSQFLDDATVLILRAYVTKDGEIELTNSVNLGSSLGKPGIAFVKKYPCALTADSLQNDVQIISPGNGTTVEQLFSLLGSFFCPAILGDPEASAHLPPKLQEILQDLQTQTGEIVRSGGEGTGSMDSFNGIHTPQDEIKFWESYRGRDINNDMVRNMNAAFDHDRGRWKEELDEMTKSDAGDWERMNEFLDQTSDILDVVWNTEGRNLKYSQDRMKNLLDCFGVVVNNFVIKQIRKLSKNKGESIWITPFSTFRVCLKSSLQLCERWLGIVSVSTSTLWPGNQDHKWNGLTHEDKGVMALTTRLEEILELRSTVEELRKLLSPEERRNHELENNEDAFRAFDGIDPLLCNSYTLPKWQECSQQWRRRLAGAETAIATNFRRTVATLITKPHLLLREFTRFSSILQRPTVATELSSERENLLGLLIEELDGLDHGFDEHLQSVQGQGCGMSKVISKIIFCRHINAKITLQMASCKPIFRNLKSFGELEAMADALIRKSKQEEQSLLREWIEDQLSDLKNDDVSLRMRGQLMEIPSRGQDAGKLVVNFDERLVVLLREVRQLHELGCTVPSEITEAATEAEKFYRYGVMLKKVAIFWNSLGEQIISSQRPLLLNALKAFEKIVMSRTADNGVEITWKTPSECEHYVERLQMAAEKLALENNALRRTHSQLALLVVNIMSVDLLKQKDLWKQRWQECLGIMETVRRKFPEEHMVRWVRFWDEQMFKALEASYRMGLESLNENLSEIKTDLVFTQKTLQFKPGIEELRSVYYREMKKFVSIPSTFPGFGTKGVYGGMAKRNTNSLLNVYRNAEELFTRLSITLEEYRPWCILGKIDDMDSYVEEHVLEVNQYEANFKMLKNKCKDTDKLPDVIKVDCVKISLSPFKSTLDDMIQRLQDSLLIALRRAVLNEFKDVDQFLNDSMDKLSTRPNSISEISAAQTAWEEMGLVKTDQKLKSNSCLEKKKCLMIHAPGGGVDVSEVVSRISNLDGEGGRWDNFDISMDAFNEMINEQKEALTSVLETEVSEFNGSIDRFAEKWKALKPTGEGLKLDDPIVLTNVFKELDSWREQYEDFKDKGSDFVEQCATFNMNAPTFESLELIENDMNIGFETWELLKSFIDELTIMGDMLWIEFRTNVFALQDLSTNWSEKIKEKIISGQHSILIEFIGEKVEFIKKAMPSLKFCRGDPFGEDHWSELLQGKLKLSRDVKLVNLKVNHFLLSLSILSEPTTVNYVKQLQARAQGEVTIREALSELKAWSLTAEVKQLEHEEGGRRTAIITGWKDLFLELGDKQSLLSSLKESTFFKAFADQGKVFDIKMTALDSHLHALNQIQRKWVYLEPIFERGALPSEQARFKRVDIDYRDICSKLEQDPKLFNLSNEALFHGLAETLEKMLDQLERCQKALTEFLEDKRNAMPRFYFLGDDDLLEILGQSKNPTVIQSHLKKLFQGISRVQFDENNSHIIAMISSMGEVVKLDTPIAVTEKVEEWLAALAKEMALTLKLLVSTCLEQGSKLEEFPSQVLQIAEQIKFVDVAEVGIADGSYLSIKKDLELLLKQYTSIPSPSLLTSVKVKALILDLVHNMDVLDQFSKHDVRSLNDWGWFKQLRYYDNSSNVKVRMVDACFDYTYEYQGNAPKLVHTPLTDKCYLTLTQGMHMGFGGNPYGPAGTGKTESVKALGQAMGRQVLVFNCDEGIDFQSMGRIFTGLVKCGAWGCFDEFNRLKEDQLSAISQQIQVIQDAIKGKTPSLCLLGRTIDVDFNAGIFVTLNPAGKGYGGRSRLPDNLKALFRPVCLALPDNEQIAEVVLYSEGYTTAKSLSTKIVSLFTLSKQLLSHQQHYEWGLRALKAILNTAGKFLGQVRAAALKEGSGNEEEEKGGNKKTDDIVTLEAETLIKAVRVNTMSKLTFGDTHRFLDLIRDLFPGVNSSDVTIPELEAAIREVMPSMGLEIDETQVRKMLQMKESIDQRIGCVVVGPSGSGKTTVWQVLQAAMMKCGHAVKTHIMNPKAMPRLQLLGYMDHDTREWTDGVLTDASRKVVVEPNEVRSWVVCDGDVDPEWIESLNSVLDDNHLLTLPNGERISFGDNVNFLFETHDLRYASPATVSRMGMIFLSEDDIDVRRVVEKWLRAQPEENREPLRGFCDLFFYRGLELTNNMDLVVDTTLVGTVNNGLSQLVGATNKTSFICGLIRGLGGNLTPDLRSKLAKDLFNLADIRMPDNNIPLDYISDDGNLVALMSAADNISPSELTLNSVIPTVAVQRTLATMASWVDNMEPFILVGPEGCGKDMAIRHAFEQRRSTSITTLNCNAQTTAIDVISKISQTCSLFSAPEGRVYRPRDSERLVLYLKDLNLPKPDQYDTCMLIAFLQQLITFGGFYDEHLEFLRMERVQIVCSMNPATTVGRHPLSTRFTATVRIAIVDYPDSNELVDVYATLLTVVFKELVDDGRLESKWISSTADRVKLASTMVEVYTQTRSKFTVDDHRHYLFTPRDLTAWVKALLRYDCGAGRGLHLLDVVGFEAQRIFADRLVDSDHRQRFDSIVSSIFRSKWGHTIHADTHFTTLGQSKSAATSKAVRLLDRVEPEDLLKICEQGLTYLEREEKDLGLLLFPQILNHLCRVDRVLSQPGGHLLLAGRSGVGRRSAVTLVSYMLGYTMVTPSVTRDFGVDALKVELKVAIQKAGIDGEATVLFLEDHQLTSDAILEVVNSLLSSGEVPGLYTHEELEPLLAPLKERANEAGIYRTAYEFFIAEVLTNLHVVISMDPTNAKFLLRCESNPALYTRCSMLWMGSWTTPSMEQLPTLLPGVAALLRGEFEDEEDDEQEGEEERVKNRKGEGKTKGEGKRSGGEGKRGSGEGKSAGIGRVSQGRGEKQINSELLNLLLLMHNSIKGATPLEFVTFLRTWKDLHDSKRGGMSQEIRKLRSGLNKLNSAKTTVDKLSHDASISGKELAAAQVKADAAMEQITATLSGASERRGEVKELSAEVEEKSKHTRERQEHIKTELSSIQPILDQAKQAVGGIKPEHLNEITALKMPPDAIADVLGAVLKLLGVRDVSWLSMKKFLRSRGVKDDILNYDASKITPSIRNEVAKLLQQKASSFDHATITRVSVAAAPLAAWVKANIKYSLVLEKIQPLTDELEKAEQELEMCTSRLSSCNAEISEIDTKVSKLKTEFAARTREAENLRNGLERVTAILTKAEGLLGQLGGEQDRWTIEAAALSEELSTLPKLMLLAAGFSTYLARSAEDVRASTMDSWTEEAHLRRGSFDFKRLLSTESELLRWKSEGLPADSLSQENALVIAKAGSRVPFVIDPANAATKWLKSFLSSDPARPLEAVAAFDPRFTSNVELAVRFGKTLLLLDMDGMEPMLFPLARRDLTKQGSRSVVVVGDKVMDWNENFRMCLVTRNPKVELSPDAAALVVEVNFSVTRSGLEGQLLGLTIQHEQPELEAQKQEMLRQEEGFKVQLADLEASLLAALAESEGDILENTVLIESLTSTKKLAAQISESLALSAKASIRLDEQRDAYRPFATAGSTLFFLVAQLSSINPVYRFSLASFTTLFSGVLENDQLTAPTVSERLLLLTPALETSLLYYVGRGLFKTDRLMWGLHLAKGMRPDLFGEKEWEFLTDQLMSSGGRVRQVPDWVSSDRAQGYQDLMDHFPRFCDNLQLDDSAKWRRFGTSAECEHPSVFPVKASAAQRLVVIKALRPDRLLTAMQHFAAEALRVSSLAPPPMPFEQLHRELATSPSMPVILMTTPGSDPSKELYDFAIEAVGRDHYKDLAMGGGQQQAALNLLNNAARDGDWLCLKNLHLVIAWLPTLEKTIASLTPTMHPKFRLWLTTEPHALFPPILLQSSLKITYESPPGIKKNVQRTLTSWGKGFLEGSSSISGSPMKKTSSPSFSQDFDIRRAQLLFLLAWFHAIVQERRTYIPQGWSKAYEFSIGDLRAGSMLLDTISRGGDLDFNLIHGLMEDAIYGGRVDNPSDLRVLRTIVAQLYNPQMLNRGGEIARGVKMPQKCGFDDLTTWVHDLPDQDAPSMFGLPENIQRAVQRSASTLVASQLRSLDVSGNATEKFDREGWKISLGPIIENWSRLIEGEALKSNKREASQPTNQFVLFENENAMALCGFIDNQLMELKKVLFGSALLTPSIQAMGSALMRGEVPAAWEKKWEGPETATAYLIMLVRKKKALTKWAELAMNGQLLRQPLNLSDLFNPGTFLNALKQESARMLKVPLEETKLVSAWQESKLSGCGLIATLDGMFIENAVIDRGELAEVGQNAAEITRSPALSLAFIPINQPDPSRGSDTLSIPIYCTPTREKHLVDVSVPIRSGDDAMWVLAGVAFLLSGE